SASAAAWLALVALTAACAPGGAAARPSPPAGALAPRAISGPSPIASCGGAEQLDDAPEEPSLAVDPADPRHLAAAWRQDPPPVVLATATAPRDLLDKPSILADPRVPGRVYAVWVRYAGETANQVGFARSDDHGRTWTSSPAMYDAGTEAQNNELLAPAAGVL